MPQPNARGIALHALAAWQTYKDRADTVVSTILAEAKLAKSDRAFVLELFYGVLRNLTLIDFWIGCLRTKSVDDDLRDILRLGLYQLMFLGIPDHAAVNESVELAEPKVRGFINGVLRTAVRDRDELRVRAKKQPLYVRASHPAFLITRWQANFGLKEAAALCAWNNQPAPIYARINGLKIDAEQFQQRYPESNPVPGQAGFFLCHELPVEALQRGHCYIQDPSTAIAGTLLDPQSGEKVLDACAAPGGKTGHLAQLMKNDGLIVACDREQKRITTLEENLKRLGATISRVFRHDWTRYKVPQEIEDLGPYDKILVDVPCTNTGVMRRRVDVRWRLQPESVANMRKQQMDIARSAAGLLKPGGVLVYSTCSLEPEENEQAVQQLLMELSNWRLGEQKQSRPFEDHMDGAFAAKILRPEVA